MKRTLILLVTHLIISVLSAHHTDICSEVMHHSNKTKQILKFLNSSDLQFQDTINQNNVCGI